MGWTLLSQLTQYILYKCCVCKLCFMEVAILLERRQQCKSLICYWSVVWRDRLLGQLSLLSYEDGWLRYDANCVHRVTCTAISYWSPAISWNFSTSQYGAYVASSLLLYLHVCIKIVRIVHNSDQGIHISINS